MAWEPKSETIPCGDAQTAHDPANGQFTSGGGSSSGGGGKKHKGKSGREYSAEELKSDFRTTHVGGAGSKGYWHPDVGHHTRDDH